MTDINIISVRENPEYLERAVDYLSSKWGISREVYHESVSDGIHTKNSLPRWYLLLKDGVIIGSYGLIENDFISRVDLKPWLCALYVEEAHRGENLGAYLLDHGVCESALLGFRRVYLCTDHVGYYEKCGWHYIGNGYSASGAETRIYEFIS